MTEVTSSFFTDEDRCWACDRFTKIEEWGKYKVKTGCGVDGSEIELTLLVCPHCKTVKSE